MAHIHSSNKTASGIVYNENTNGAVDVYEKFSFFRNYPYKHIRMKAAPFITVDVIERTFMNKPNEYAKISWLYMHKMKINLLQMLQIWHF